MTALTKEQILAYNDKKLLRINIPEWGEDAYVNVKVMSGSERDWYEGTLVQIAQNKSDFSKANIRANVAAMVICDDEGNKLFSPSDIKALGEKSGVALDRILEATLKHSGLDKDAVEDSESFLSIPQLSDSGSS